MGDAEAKYATIDLINAVMGMVASLGSTARPLVISFAQQPLMRRAAALFNDLDVRFIGDIAAPTRMATFSQARAMIAAGNAVNERTLAPWGQLEYVQTLGSGYNNLDLAALALRRIVAAHNRGQNAQAVAEHVLMSAMYLLRDMGDAHEMVLGGSFGDRQRLAGSIRDLSGLTLGIYGLGSIGQRLAAFGKVFDLHMVYHQRHRNLAWERETAIRYVPAGALWGMSDIVVLAVPLTEATHHLAGPDSLSQMKPSAVLVNVGRGAVVDEHALADVLMRRAIYGAALDVFESEPLDASSPLRNLPLEVRRRVLFSPHIAGMTTQSLEKMAASALRNVQHYFSHEPLRDQLIPEDGLNPWDWRNALLQK